MTSSLIGASFHFLSEDQDWSEPESCKKCEDCRLPGDSSGVYFNLFTENTDHVQSRFQMGCEPFSLQALDCLWLLFYFFFISKVTHFLSPLLIHHSQREQHQLDLLCAWACRSWCPKSTMPFSSPAWPWVGRWDGGGGFCISENEIRQSAHLWW